MELLLTPAWWVMAGLATVAGIARGLAGFGVGLVMMPVGAILFGPQIMVPMIALIDIPAALYLMGGAWRIFDRRDVGRLTLAAVLTLPLGIYALTVLDAAVLALAVNAIALAAALALLAGVRIGGRPSAARSISIGAVAGLLQGSVSLPGPPVILGWVAAQVPGPVLRANIIMFFLVIDAVAVPMHWAAGLFTEAALVAAASLGPIYLAGTVAGRHLFGRVPPEVFRKVVLGLVILGAASGIALSLYR
jgi:uncharacterized membrane protein YfcA